MIHPFVVLERSGWSYRVLGDMPTPALIDASNGGRPHDAYQHPDTGFWRVRDEKYDAPGTVYTSVYVAHVPVCPGESGWSIDHNVEWATPLFGPRKQCRSCAEQDGIVEKEEDDD